MSGEVTSRPKDGGLSAAPFVPDTRSIARLRAAAAGCEGCPLYVDATQTVFGERAGAAAAGRRVVMLVGEQPGNDEDLEGHPFVGPAGRVLWSCVDEAGLAREQLFVTNAVKHFKHERRGKRRLHRRPDAAEIDACAPWLRAEVRAVRPVVIVALGASAARSIFGRTIAIAAARAEPPSSELGAVVVTYHPSAILHSREPAPLRAALVADLRAAGRHAGR